MEQTINNSYILDEDESAIGSAPVNVTTDIAPFVPKIGKILKRKRPMKHKNIFSTMDIKEDKLSKSEFESLKYNNESVLVPMDDDNIDFKLLNFDEYGNVFENNVIVNNIDRKIYIESNSKETLNYLLMESSRNYNNMRLPEMKHIYNFSKSLLEGYTSVVIFNNDEYYISFS